MDLQDLERMDGVGMAETTTQTPSRDMLGGTKAATTVTVEVIWAMLAYLPMVIPNTQM